MVRNLKVLLLRPGCDAKPQVFLFADSQIKDGAFVEDINMILNTGDISNLYPPEEKAEILEKMTAIARDQVSMTITRKFTTIKTI